MKHGIRAFLAGIALCTGLFAAAPMASALTADEIIMMSKQGLSDTSNLGDSNKCCKSGYRMENGVCVANICDKIQYPYSLRPGSEMGEVEECREADESAPLGYRSYFGYNSCKTDIRKGEMWMPDPNNSRRCICSIKTRFNN